MGTRISFRSIDLARRHPLRLSRGEAPRGRSLFAVIEEGGLTGIGEAAPNAVAGAESPEACQRALEDFLAQHDFDASRPEQNWHAARCAGVPPCAHAALDVAGWDLLARRSGLPLYRVLGLSRRSVPTSVTVGILPPEEVRERVEEVLARAGARRLKVKLGSPEGIEADQAMFSAVLEAVRGSGIHARVDANGGWSVEGARTMLGWLADRGVEWVEQPLAQGCEQELPGLFRDRPLPLFVDESCRSSIDVPRLAGCVDGINVKLMKCGGITEALRLVATARAYGLQAMLGCMCESSVSISAAASLASLFDAVDLDSHLNLACDPARGAVLEEGVVLPADAPGHGAQLL